MQDIPARDLSENQFGFRKKRSTCDALLRVKAITTEAVNEGGVAIAIGLDIENLFNSLPWRTIRKVLIDKGFPVYLRRIVDSYLSDRHIQYRTIKGTATRRMEAGVPQGSVLGLLLWNIAFDSVLTTPKEIGCHVICYADDTLVIATANCVQTAVVRAGIRVSIIMREIQRLGLRVAEAKTETVVFHGKVRPDPLPRVSVGRSKIDLGKSMKYLGIIIDSRWSFRDHFSYVEEKVFKVTRALGRLMPNLRGPDENKRQLYANVVHSVILYGAPV